MDVCFESILKRCLAVRLDKRTRRDEIKDNDIGSCGVFDRKVERSRGRLIGVGFMIARL